MSRDDDTSKTLIAKFTRRDLALYALSVGCNGDDLSHCYESHPDFEPLPSFLLSLIFMAQSEGDRPFLTGIRRFPPSFMRHAGGVGPLPRRFLSDSYFDEADSQDSPTVLHMSQSLSMHSPIILREPTLDDPDPPTTTKINVAIEQVKPRGIGTFVKTKMEYSQDGTLVATSEMVALILGIDPSHVVPLDDVSEQPASKKMKSRSQIFRATETKMLQFDVPRNAALLYRLTGDYNQIHVDGGSLFDRPLLHGLCSLGMVSRAILQYTESKASDLKSIDCHFTKPVFIGDALEMWILRNDGCIDFCVTSQNKGEVKVKGKLLLVQKALSSL
mmetsp:Transcript_22502/g.51666  ORF Transcript_22502/g.51666 Transcript_22502/m.51666 type:complete len:330 (+) Transcript_22502:408-1397(+)